MNEQQTKKAEEGDSRRFEEFSLEEIERELRALRECEDQLTLNESILAGICISELEAARKRKLRDRRVAESVDPGPEEREEE